MKGGKKYKVGQGMGYSSREGVIIEWSLNGLFHDRRDVIITSRMFIIRFPSNDGRYLKCRRRKDWSLVKST